MRRGLRRLGWTLPVGAAMLLLAACGSTPTPTAAGAAAVTTAATVSSPASVLVSGVVVDSANRPLAKANVECMGNNVTCTAPTTQVIAQDGPDDGVFTRADGTYSMVVTASGADGVLLSAHTQSYEVQFQRVKFPDTACTSDQMRCAITLNFTLSGQGQ